ncbi:hypothetical protein CROQUDRAFT_206597 [Cronartium quercuum f. sp. fusiforme G11]|uniref:Transmembrane protein 19 n=1 Tax=Cronartium quercuum f. sp. fusiforme G11 TaxID=708437 RepID=A0A9P6T8U4_9BASI|nr:hypothetical protein CROQUDRAFT_206597 [Cronartium quercuum f. sp. fusiforme G11]
MTGLNNIGDLYPGSFLLVVLLSVHTFRKGSLQRSGVIAAFTIGYATLANPNSIFGTSLLAFFFLGNQATKYKKAIKSTLVDDEHSAGAAPVVHGLRAVKAPIGRDWKQVLCNAWLGTLCAIIYRFLVHPVNTNQAKANDGKYLGFKGLNYDLLSDTLLYGALAFWSGCCGDTLASELGILSRSRPRLIATLKAVPPGTNGAVSLVGLGLSAFGGVCIGLAVSFRCLLEECRTPSGSSIMGLSVKTGLFGLFCSVLDSVLGATLQQTLYSQTDKKIVRPGTVLGGPKRVVVVTGSNLLSNNQVNIISSTTTALLAMTLCWARII